MRADVILPDGRRITNRHVMKVAGNIATTSFGTFKYRRSAWRWVRDESVTLAIVNPVTKP